MFEILTKVFCSIVDQTIDVLLWTAGNISGRIRLEFQNFTNN